MRHGMDSMQFVVNSNFVEIPGCITVPDALLSIPRSKHGKISTSMSHLTLHWKMTMALPIRRCPTVRTSWEHGSFISALNIKNWISIKHPKTFSIRTTTDAANSSNSNKPNKNKYIYIYIYIYMSSNMKKIENYYHLKRNKQVSSHLPPA